MRFDRYPGLRQRGHRFRPFWTTVKHEKWEPKLVDQRDSSKPEKGSKQIPPIFNRRAARKNAKDKDRDAKLDAIAEQFLKADKTGIELDIERGRLLRQARELLKQHQAWIKWHTERLGLDAMPVNILIRRADAAEKHGIKNLIKLGKSVLDILIAPEAPEEAIVEGLERSKKGQLSCAEARLIVRECKEAKGHIQKRGRKPKAPAPEITLKNTPVALARHLATYPPEPTHHRWA